MSIKRPGNVFASTGAFARMTVEEIIETAASAGISHIELASGTRHVSGDDLALTLNNARKDGYAFLVHNYFPVPADPFVLNLASANSKTLERSIRHVMSAVELAASIGSPFYSVHCGFCVDPAPEELGKALRGRAIPLEQALDIFVETVRELARHAQRWGVDLLLENNVLSKANAGRVELLGVTPEDILLILQRIDCSNVGLLLDVAHLKVSANSMAFDMCAAAARLAPFVRCFHLSDNDGNADTNEIVSSGAWFWEPILPNVTQQAIWVLEAYDLSLHAIRGQLDIIDRCVETVPGHAQRDASATGK
jgi:sugar phosphate isomerase/epimerase